MELITHIKSKVNTDRELHLIYENIETKLQLYINSHLYRQRLLDTLHASLGTNYLNQRLIRIIKLDKSLFCIKGLEIRDKNEQ